MAAPRRRGTHSEEAPGGQDFSEKARASFSAWRCLWDPRRAVDPDESEPFQRLEITVQRALKLTAADWNFFNQTSDPYVTLSLNGAKEPERRIDPEINGESLTFAQMQKIHRDEAIYKGKRYRALSHEELKDKWKDLEKTDSMDFLPNNGRSKEMYPALPFQRTSIKSKNLSPVWDESFKFDIYHPLSVISLKVYDSDKHQFEGLVSKDDFLGWIDISLGGLPFNEEVEGWMDLHHPDEYIKELDAKKNDKDDKDPHVNDQYAGRIRLKMRLRVDAAELRREFFAMCLPDPPRPIVSQHHKGGSLDVGHLLQQATKLQQKVAQLGREIDTAVSRVSRFGIPVVVYILGLYMCWHPTLVLPTIVFFIGWVITMIEKEGDKSNVDEGSSPTLTKVAIEDNAKPEVRNVSMKRQTVEQLPGGGTVTMSEECSIREPLLAGVERAPQRQATILQKAQSGLHEAHLSAVAGLESTAASAKKQARALKRNINGKGDEEESMKNLKYVNSLIETFNGELAEQLMDVDSQVHDLLHVVSDVNKFFFKSHFRSYAKMSFLVIIAILMWAQSYQGMVLQILITIWMSQEFFNRSILGRFYHATESMCSRHKRLVQLHKDGEGHYRFEEQGEGKDTSHHGHSTHDFKPETFTRLTWCTQCGILLKGLRQQGWKCRRCKSIVCSACERTALADCIDKFNEDGQLVKAGAQQPPASCPAPFSGGLFGGCCKPQTDPNEVIVDQHML